MFPIGMILQLFPLLLLLLVVVWVPVQLISGGGVRKMKRLGFVADFCLLCRCIRPFRIARQKMEDNSLFRSLHKKNLFHHEATCMVCNTPREVDPATYISIAKKADPDLERLIQETFPGIHRVYADRLRMEKARAEGKLTALEKEALVDETFALFEDKVLENSRAFLQAKGPGLWLLGLTILASAVGTYLINGGLKLDRGQSEAAVLLLASGFFAGLFLSVVLMIAESGRTLRRRILPVLARSLGPLGLSRNEVEQALERSKKAGACIGKKIRVETLWNEISRLSGAYEGSTGGGAGSFGGR